MPSTVHEIEIPPRPLPERRGAGRGLSSIFALAALAASCAPSGERPASAPTEEENAAAVPSEVIQQDIDEDGTIDTVFVYRELDERGRAEADTDGDQKIDLWVTSDERGLEQVAYDRDRDGRPDEWEDYDGLRVTERRRDTTGDGEPDHWSLFDDEAILVETREDSDGDGRPNVWSTLDPGGALQRAAYDTNGDGEPDRWVNYREDGSVASIQTDTDGDGIPDTITVPPRR